MASKIHPTAIVESSVELGEDVEVGAYAFVGGTAVIGTGSRLHHHASVEGNTVMGAGCEVFPYACIGARTQDLKFKGGSPGLRVGERNTFREYVSVHCATKDGDFTRLGDQNTILAYCHIAHDCVLGNGIIMSNGAVLAGHAIIEDHVVLGGYSGVHQFCRVGAHAMLSAYGKLVSDLPPFFIADGVPAVVRAYNKIGLERHAYTPDQLDRVRRLYRLLYYDGYNRTQALAKIAEHADAASAEFQRMLAFAGQSTRGLASGGRAASTA